LGDFTSVQMMLMVVASAFGPSLFAIFHDTSHGYKRAFFVTMVLPTFVGLLALGSRPPSAPSEV
jgi:hypothetical protein